MRRKKKEKNEKWTKITIRMKKKEEKMNEKRTKKVGATEWAREEGVKVAQKGGNSNETNQAEQKRTTDEKKEQRMKKKGGRRIKEEEETNVPRRKIETDETSPNKEIRKKAKKGNTLLMHSQLMN